MIIFKIYLDNQEIKDKVNEYIENWDNFLYIQNEHLLMTTYPICECEWKEWDNWLTLNDIDFKHWKVI